jgi:hypothetical protein
MGHVAFQRAKGAEFELAELVEVKGGWATIRVGEETLKVRKGQVALSDDGNPDESVLADLLTDADAEFDDEGPVHRGDVFPEGIRERYIKSQVGGKTVIDCGDDLAEQLRGMSLDEVALRAQQILGQRTAAGWIALYTTDREAEGKNPLNPGMVRMNLGNRIRAALKRQEEEAAPASK